MFRKTKKSLKDIQEMFEETNSFKTKKCLGRKIYPEMEYPSASIGQRAGLKVLLLTTP